jgi:hypothetical protein
MITPAFNLTATERVLPKLALDFTTASLDSRVTFTRSGNTATRVNSSGYIESVNADIARFDFDPVTLACKGLLIEEARTNVMTFSEDVSTFPNKTNTTVSTDQINAPTNAQTADKIIETTATAQHLMFKGNPVVSGTTYTCSVFFKKGERFKVRLRTLSSFADNQVDFNLDNGTITAGSVGTITNYGNGWYRCTITVAATATDSNGRLYIYLLDDNGNVSYTGVTDYGLYAWGVQVEAGAFATSYIPTAATAVTRNADVATITGTNFSDFWQTVKGGASVLATPSIVSGIRPLVQFDDNTADNIIALRGNTTNPELYIVDGGTPQAQIDAGTIAANTAYSLTGWWQENNSFAQLNTQASVRDNTVTIPTVTQARIGSDGTNYLNGTTILFSSWCY